MQGSMKKRRQVLLNVETSLAFGRNVLEGISRYLVEKLPWTVQLDLRELIMPDPEWLSSWEGDGIICRSASPELARKLKKLNIPTVDLTDMYGGNILPSIWNDHHAIGKLAATHLIERGFVNFGFCGFSDHHWSSTRQAGFCQQVEETGVVSSLYSSDWGRVREGGWDVQQAEIKKWLTELPKPVGIMGCNDVRGQHVLEACNQLDLAVPEKVAVIGVDNDQVLCDFCDPPLTSVIPNAKRIGYLAAELLDRLMNGEEPEENLTLVEPSGIATRQSTDVLAIGDELVADAVRFIRENACNGIRVADLLREVPISRRLLEIRFQKFLGRSPQAEIRNTQLKRVCQLLSETDLAIEQISRLTGFKHSEYLSVVFKRELDITPGAYRKTHHRST